MKAKLFTHIDLDGVGCAIVGKQAFNESLDVQFCGNSTIDEKVWDFLNSQEQNKYDVIFITDLSVGEQLAKHIDKHFSQRVQLIDHHDTASWLNKYSWADVNVYETPYNPSEKREEVLASGTSLFHLFLVECGLLVSNYELDEFCEMVRRYDTWEWKNYYNDQVPDHLNMLLQTIGLFDFYHRFSKDVDITLNTTERALLDVELKRRDNYVERKAEEFMEQTVLNYNVGVVFAESYFSELGNYLAEKNPHLDFIMMINPSGFISYRGVRDDIDLGKIAEKFGGGGHQKAAGNPIEQPLIHESMRVLIPR